MPLSQGDARSYIHDMSRMHRPLAAIVLALLLVFTAQSMAVARGMAGPAAAVVLCTGTGPVTILTDADGQPVGPAHICPDCTLSLILSVAQDAPSAIGPMGRTLVLIPDGDLVARARQVQPFSARDPPGPV
jgi:hypothetical protein